MTETLIGGYSLGSGSANWTSSLLTDYSFFFLNLIWSNVTGTGTISIRQTDGTEYETIQEVTLSGSESFTEINNINVNKKYLNIRFDGTATGKFSAILTANKNNLQTHNASFDTHEPLKRYTLMLS